jgi:hypothetical protein
MNGAMPASFAWPVFVGGMAMAATAAGAALTGAGSGPSRGAGS